MARAQFKGARRGVAGGAARGRWALASALCTWLPAPREGSEEERETGLDDESAQVAYATLPRLAFSLVEAEAARGDGGADAEVEWRESGMGTRFHATSAVRVPPVPPLVVGDPEPSPSIRNAIKDASTAPFPVY